jgi:hypothetical protein
MNNSNGTMSPFSVEHQNAELHNKVNSNSMQRNPKTVHLPTLTRQNNNFFSLKSFEAPSISNNI